LKIGLIFSLSPTAWKPQKPSGKGVPELQNPVAWHPSNAPWGSTKHDEKAEKTQDLVQTTRNAAELQMGPKERKISSILSRLFQIIDSYVILSLERTSFLLQREPGLPLLPGSLFLFGLGSRSKQGLLARLFST
jgi:hypothetical protein